MLSPDDARLVRRDSELPGLAHVLDPDRFAEWFAERGVPQRIERVRPRYTRYKPGTNCLVAYDVDTADTSIVVTIKAFRPPAADKLAKAARWTGKRTLLGSASIIWPELAILATVFPYDLKLRALPKVMGHGSADILRALLPPSTIAPTLEILSYKPERRLVARCRGVRGDAVVRVHTVAEFQTISRGFGGSIDGVRIPHTLGCHSHYPIMATEWIDGEGGTSVFDEVERAAAVGEALACLHQAPVGVGPLRARNDELRDLRIVGNGLANLLPKQAPRVMHLSRALADGLAVTRGPLVPTHGDFALRQVVFARDGVALTDLDAAAIAEPANDIGSFLADLDLHVVNGDLDVGRSGVIASRFLDGYRSVRALPAGTELYHAIHLLRVAPQPFRMRSREWCIRADALVDRAEAAMARRRRSRDSNLPAGGDVLDRAMPWLAAATDPVQVTTLMRALPWISQSATVESAWIRRHKPGRRCLIEYAVSGYGAPILGKTRAKGLDLRTATLAERMRRNGFGDTAADGIEVPPFLGSVPALRMWLQMGVAGESAGALLASGRLDVAERLVQAIRKLQRHGPVPERTHTLGDELDILRQRLDSLAARRPRIATHLARVVDGCQRLVSSLPDAPLAPAHRDFYPEQVLIDGSRVVLLDLDLYALAHPALDVGNCIGHLLQRALQHPEEAAALDTVIRRMRDASASQLPRGDPRAVDGFATLTLARLIEIADRLSDRHHLVEPLLETCVQRLAAAGALVPSISRSMVAPVGARRHG